MLFRRSRSWLLNSSAFLRTGTAACIWPVLDYIQQFPLINGMLSSRRFPKPPSSLGAPRSGFDFNYCVWEQQCHPLGDSAHQPGPGRLQSNQPRARVLRQHAGAATAGQTDTSGLTLSLQPSRTARCISVEQPLWRFMGCCRSSWWRRAITRPVWKSRFCRWFARGSV